MNGGDDLPTNHARNPWVIASFCLGFSSSLYETVIGVSYFTGWRLAEIDIEWIGAFELYGAFILFFGLLGVLGSVIVLVSKRKRVLGAILILIFFFLTSMQGIFTAWEFFIMLLMPISSFMTALYVVKREWGAETFLGFRFVYTGIRVNDMDESIRFYTDVLGMKVVEKREIMKPTKGEIVTLKSKDSSQLLELNFYEVVSPFYAPYVNGEDLDHLAFDVEDLEANVSALRRKGIEVVVEPFQIGGSKQAFVKDPNGIWIELLQRK